MPEIAVVEIEGRGLAVGLRHEGIGRVGNLTEGVPGPDIAEAGGRLVRAKPERHNVTGVSNLFGEPACRHEKPS